MAPPPEVFYRLPLIEHLIFFAFFHPDFHPNFVVKRSLCRQQEIFVDPARGGLLCGDCIGKGYCFGDGQGAGDGG